MLRTIEDAEFRDEDGRGYLHYHVQVGDEIDLGDWIGTVTAEAIGCDCGKGAYCPAIKQRKK